MTEWTLEIKTANKAANLCEMLGGHSRTKRIALNLGFLEFWEIN